MRDRKVRYILLLSTITISATLIFFILILVNQLGYFNVTSAKDNPFIQPKVSILLSNYNFDYFKDNQSGYQEIIDQWYDTLKGFNIRPKILKDKDLEGDFDSDILILPSTVCLSLKEIESVKKFVRSGGGLIMSWAAGARREGGSFRDYEFIEDMTKAEVIKMETRGSLSISDITLNSASPITAGMPSGLRMNLSADNTEILARHKNVDSFYSDWRMYPITTTKGYPPYVAISHNEYGEGKVLWFTFNTNRLLLNDDNRTVFRKIVYNALLWMSNLPIGKLENWPFGHEMAFLMDQDTEHEHQNASISAAIIKEEGVSATFFCISSIFEKDPLFLKSLPDSIEIGSHLDTAETLASQSYQKQYSRIKKSKDALEKLTGKKVVGLKAAEEIFDHNTIKTLIDLGFEYMIGGPNTPIAVPIVIRSIKEIIAYKLRKK